MVNQLANKCANIMNSDKNNNLVQNRRGNDRYNFHRRNEGENK